MVFKISPYMQITRPFLKWLLPFFAVLGGAIGAYGGLPMGNDLILLSGTLVLFCFVVQGICIRVTNDIFDAELDRLSEKEDSYSKFRPIANNVISKRQAGIYATAGYTVALIVSYMLNIWIFAIVALTLAAQFVYSAPPLRLKAVFPINNALIGIFYGGGFFLSGWLLFAPLSANALYAAAFLSFMAFVFSMSKDYSDIEGDKAKRVSTLPVVFGIRKAGMIHTILYISIYAILGLFVFYGIFPIYSLMLVATLFMLVPMFATTFKMNEKSSQNSRRKVMNMAIPVSFVIYVLLGISLAMV